MWYALSPRLGPMLLHTTSDNQLSKGKEQVKKYDVKTEIEIKRVILSVQIIFAM
jgi:hypothetical protein